MDNPLQWCRDFAEYVIDDHRDFHYGDFVLLKENTPAGVMESYKKYIKLIGKVLQSWDNIIIENWEIKGFVKVNDVKMQEQCNIVMELIKKGYIEKNIKH